MREHPYDFKYGLLVVYPKSSFLANRNQANRKNNHKLFNLNIRHHVMGELFTVILFVSKRCSNCSKLIQRCKFVT